MSSAVRQGSRADSAELTRCRRVIIRLRIRSGPRATPSPALCSRAIIDHACRVPWRSPRACRLAELEVEADTLGQLLGALAARCPRWASSSTATGCTRRSSPTSTAIEFVSDPAHALAEDDRLL